MENGHVLPSEVSQFNLFLIEFALNSHDGKAYAILIRLQRMHPMKILICVVLRRSQNKGVFFLLLIWK